MIEPAAYLLGLDAKRPGDIVYIGGLAGFIRHLRQREARESHLLVDLIHDAGDETHLLLEPHRARAGLDAQRHRRADRRVAGERELYVWGEDAHRGRVLDRLR